MQSGLKYSSAKETKMQGVPPGTAQEIPELAVIAVILTAGWDKIIDWMRSRKKAAPAAQQEK